MKRIIVIGGGAAGMMAAIWAARGGASVTLLEKNEKLGKKLFITGKGRCNLTNACDTEALFRNVVTNSKFLYSAFYGFDNHQTMDFFEGIGLPLKVERGNRVFPASDHSSDVIKVLERECRRLRVTIRLNTRVSALICTETNIKHEMAASNKGEQGQKKNEGKQSVLPYICGVRLEEGSILEADRIIVACGGISYPGTGAVRDGYALAEAWGHEIKPCYPSLVPFTVKEQWCRDVMGLSLKNVSVRIMCGRKKVFEDFGEMLFTHFGVSGPLIISASAYIHQYIHQQPMLYIDLKPALNGEQLDARILRDFEKNKNKQFKHALGELLPKSLIPVLVENSGISGEKKVNEVTKQERTALVEVLKNLPLTITGLRGYDEAIVTKGGVSVKQVNPSTMESKLVKGLYFSGEVLDLDALTGGFNLQIAWSTGYLAGISASGTLN